MAGDILVAKRGRLVTIGGRDFVIKRGQTARAGHPIIDGNEELFEPLVPTYEVEQKPAAPRKAAADKGMGGD